MKTLGILGGMGPQATVRLYREIISLSREGYGAVRNSDYPHLLIDSIPVMDLVINELDEELTVKQVAEEAMRLYNSGADYIVMACNTMHKYQTAISHEGALPFVSLIDVVADKVASSGFSKVGILGSRTLIKSRLYQGLLNRRGVQCVVPNDVQQEMLVDIIHAIIAGSVDANQKNALTTIIEDMESQGAQAVILGCTELPLIVSDGDVNLPVIDSLMLLVEKSCELVYS